TGGGYVLIRKSTAPVERSMEQTRRFMADAAHELRTPITILRTRAEVGLAQEREPARDRAMLEAIARETARLGGLAGDLLTPAGGRVRLDVATVDGRAAVVVTDTGIGIPAVQLPHVFERFYRGDQARREAEGAGLGLAIARWIADAHGARIEIGPAPGGDTGTRVTVSFPVSPDLS